MPSQRGPRESPWPRPAATTVSSRSAIVSRCSRRRSGRAAGWAPTAGAAILRAMTTNGDLRLGPDFAATLAKALPRLLAADALPEDWGHRATTYDLPRFDTDVDFASRFEAALSEILASDVRSPEKLRDRLAAVGL